MFWEGTCRGAWCSDPARLLLLLFFHFVQHLEESFLASEWWGHPKVIQPSPCVLCWGTLLNVGGAVVIQCAQSFNHVHLTCKAGITNTAPDVREAGITSNLGATALLSGG